MRFINRNGKKPNKDWLKKAKKLTDQLRAAKTRAARNKIIDQNARTWGSLRSWLLKLSDGKCWFSEAKDLFTHGTDVEHFRPKKSAKDESGKIYAPDGYWWLAFDWTNYRICGNVGNRKKGTFFPLSPTSVQATDKHPHLIEDEQPLLLDPAVKEDPELLTFDEKGDAKPIRSCKGWRRQRVNYSIDRLKLNKHQQLREARKKLWLKCRSDIAVCKRLLREQDLAPTVTKRRDIAAVMERLAERVQPEAILSATAMACLMASGSDWAKKLALRGRT